MSSNTTVELDTFQNPDQKVSSTTTTAASAYTATNELGRSTSAELTETESIAQDQTFNGAWPLKRLDSFTELSDDIWDDLESDTCHRDHESWAENCCGRASSACKWLTPIVLISLVIIALTMQTTPSISSTSILDQSCDYCIHIKDSISNNPANQFFVANMTRQTNHCMDPNVIVDDRGYEPPTRTIRVLLSLIPIVMVFYGILILRLSSRYVAPATMLVTAYLGMEFFLTSSYFFGDSTATAAGKVLLSIADMLVWCVSDFAFNVFAALLLLRILEIWGIIESMRKEFEYIAPTRNAKIAVVGYCFAIALSVVAPGGSNFVVAGALLIHMNLLNLPETHPDRLAANSAIGSVCLFGNALTSPCGLLAIAVTVLGEEVGPLSLDPRDIARSESDLSEYAAEQVGKFAFQTMFVFYTVSPLIMVWLYNAGRTGFTASKTYQAIRSDIPMLLGLGLASSISALVTGWWIDYQLVALMAGGMPLALYYAFRMFQMAREASEAGVDMPKRNFSRYHWAPFGLLLLLLLALGLVPGLKDTLKGGDDGQDVDILNPTLLDIDNDGTKFQRRFSYLTNSGVMVIIVALLTPFIVPAPTTPPSVAGVSGGGVDAPFTESTARSVKRFRATVLRHRLRLAVLAASAGGFKHPLQELRPKGRIGPKEAHAVSPAMKPDSLIDSTQQAKPSSSGALDVKEAEAQPRAGDAGDAHDRDDDVAMKQIGTPRPWKALHHCFRDAFHEVLPVVISITAFASIAKLMGRFGMTLEIAEFIVDLLSGASTVYVAMMPLIAGIGSALTGSSTTSAFLFAQLQVQTARALGLINEITGHNSVYEIAAVHNLGSTFGEIISPMNAVVITLIRGVNGTEADLIKRVLPLAVGWLFATMIVAIVFIVPTNGFN
jgi:L-lactate permease